MCSGAQIFVEGCMRSNSRRLWTPGSEPFASAQPKATHISSETQSNAFCWSCKYQHFVFMKTLPIKKLGECMKGTGIIMGY